MIYGPYIPLVKSFSSFPAADGVYCEYYSVDRKDYVYCIVRQSSVVLKLDFVAGKLTWVTPYYNNRVHGVSKAFIINGRTILQTCKLYIHGVDYTEVAHSEGIDFNSESDVGFMMLKYSVGG